ncbi:divalent metal cation (Fe/Co/Zn/Cd) transporter [Dyadobacter sp. BE34]|uniref:Divalent metal cation (Fe/Co/Zn/Cd) transporter n=1 Tax=Dyadobacter fermentans TaxID=94254 RepID=A0ABU1R8N6_9BACT|nr:divalent metal cation (Fe/Co/Zn/Cd) transporter [Dyadobacter fermentans]MDR7047522.1 divalent metal cation (Fe/Co/Zn/Cd) transporter [Dyadobacter sp. BE242]MDR7201692.1 divalent metal cation (Fe/Co/Zn/Cd) transporter [Dyadobacter sp. BE34]MDR7219562.1 divalent metal cation (Fe/Co/Zn/Cd) transporter [Dyadobacter sp. BE31]MDR7267315.1 divalent metal cation (Fe/Co/Zn/Cd) transporter [Dyadobacter sp. BE32]OJV17326.1 MAG: hypothetical protein BGO21_25915 [Dyadobacter sp. 50-39]
MLWNILAGVGRNIESESVPGLEFEIRAVSLQEPGIVGTEKCSIRRIGLTYHVDLHAIVNDIFQYVMAAIWCTDYKTDYSETCQIWAILISILNPIFETTPATNTQFFPINML